MAFTKIPIVCLVFLATFLAAPLIYTLDKLLIMEQPFWIFLAGVITLPVFGLMCSAFVAAGDTACRKEPLFYVWCIFAFTGVVDLFIALELDGYVKGFMEFYLREGEPYLASHHGTMINWWDGIGHYSMYLVMIALASSGKSFREVGLFWVGSIAHSMIVFMPGNMTGNKGIKWSYLLNVPYVFYPFYAGVRFLREGMRIKHKPQTAKKETWQLIVEWMFGVWFVAAIIVAAFRMIAAMGCKEEITHFYVTSIEPYILDPFQYGKMQMLVYFYYFTPFYVGAICSLLYRGQAWVKDWSIIHAGAATQAQFVYITCSLKWRTEPEFKVPYTLVARSIFWPVNLSLLIVPILFAIYCNRAELGAYIEREVTPRLKGESTKKVDVSPRRPVFIEREVIPQLKGESTKKVDVSPRRPVTRQQKKIHVQ